MKEKEKELTFINKGLFCIHNIGRMNQYLQICLALEISYSKNVQLSNNLFSIKVINKSPLIRRSSSALQMLIVIRLANGNMFTSTNCVSWFPRKVIYYSHIKTYVDIEILNAFFFPSTLLEHFDFQCNYFAFFFELIYV